MFLQRYILTTAGDALTTYIQEIAEKSPQQQFEEA
jgi:hypothetical protein